MCCPARWPWPPACAQRCLTAQSGRQHPPGDVPLHGRWEGLQLRPSRHVPNTRRAPSRAEQPSGPCPGDVRGDSDLHVPTLSLDCLAHLPQASAANEGASWGPRESGVQGPLSGWAPGGFVGGSGVTVLRGRGQGRLHLKGLQRAARRAGGAARKGWGAEWTEQVRRDGRRRPPAGQGEGAAARVPNRCVLVTCFHVPGRRRGPHA